MSDLERFEKWFRDSPKNMYYAVAWKAWKAALSTRKAYGYGIVDKDGIKSSSLAYETALGTQSHVDEWNEKYVVGYPFRLVELFYEDSES